MDEGTILVYCWPSTVSLTPPPSPLRKIFFSFLSVYEVGCVCRIPSLYDGDLMQEEEVLLWLIEQKTTDTIEQVTDKV